MTDHHKLKFYTILKGYGCSDFCRGCLAKHNGFGVSKVSQELFWIIYNSLENKNNIHFNDLNAELKICLTPEERDIFKLLNRSYYRVDFVQDNKIIEFDGTYWHREGSFDELKDEFFVHKGFKVLRIPEADYYKNKQDAINKCINFLTQ